MKKKYVCVKKGFNARLVRRPVTFHDSRRLVVTPGCVVPEAGSARTHGACLALAQPGGSKEPIHR
jgi:hypothetical protein